MSEDREEHWTDRMTDFDYAMAGLELALGSDAMDDIDDILASYGLKYSR